MKKTKRFSTLWILVLASWTLVFLLFTGALLSDLIFPAQNVRSSTSGPRAVDLQGSVETLGNTLASVTQTRPESQAGIQDEPTPIPTEDTASTPGAIIRLRPYSETSIWNTPIDSTPQYDPFSDEMIATLGLKGGRITSDSSQYSYPVYFVDESTPRWDISCTRYKCTIVTLEGVSRTRQLNGVPIPPNAQPSRGKDAQMIIIDKTTYTEYNLFEVKRTGSGWSVGNGSVYNILWDGTPAKYGSRGAGVPYYAGLVRPWEIAQGRIQHAIAFGYPNPAKDRCVFPASKTDGKGTLPYAIPEGARLQLDPSLTEADFDQMGLDRTGKIIAQALQEYGMILIDASGRPKIYAEDLKNNPYATLQWSDPELNLTTTTIASIPYTSFRVLALPEAYWNPALGNPSHGECYAHSDAADSNPAARPTPQPSSVPMPTPAITSFEPFGTLTIEPDFELRGLGQNVDSIAFWEAPDPYDTLMVVTAKNNQLLEVWQYPFVDNQLSPVRHTSFGSDTRVNGVVIDQEQNRLYVSVSEPASTVSVFSVPEFQFMRGFIEGGVNLKSEPNITLLKHANGQTWVYVSADDIVYIHNAQTGTKIGQFKPAKGLETLVADDFHQVIYIPDENYKTGIYAYNPDGTPHERGGTHNFGGGGIFRSDAEGIALYTCPPSGDKDNGSGFLVVAEQNSDETDFEFFDRQSWEHLGTLRLEGVSNTDGTASMQEPLPDYPLGMFAAVNDDKGVAGVGWAKILDATGLNCSAPTAR